MIIGYSRRLFHERRNLAAHFVWVESLVTRSASTVERLVPDPDAREISLDDFETIGDFLAAMKESGNG